MNETFTTALYLFSSLLQADAAILGFGAIFVVYKLQALEARINLLVEVHHSRGGPHARLVNELVCAQSDEEKAKGLRAFSLTSREYKNMEELVTIPLWRDQIKSKVWIPLAIIGSHSIASTILLSLAPLLSRPEVLRYFPWIAALTIVWFSVGVGISCWSALKVLAKTDELSLLRLSKSVYDLVHESKAST